MKPQRVAIALKVAAYAVTVLLLWLLAFTIGTTIHSTIPQMLAGVAVVLWVGFYYAGRMPADRGASEVWFRDERDILEGRGPPESGAE